MNETSLTFRLHIHLMKYLDIVKIAFIHYQYTEIETNESIQFII